MNELSNKDWTGNRVSYTKTNGYANDAKQERHHEDYYATEPKAIEELLKIETFQDVWECACGEGHLSEVLDKNGILKKASDLVDRGYGSQEDFLNSSLSYHGDIITNPPYKYAEQFIRKALSSVDIGNKVAMFLPIRYLEGRVRKKMFEELPPQTVYVFSYRIKCAMNGEFEKMKGGSAVCYAWYVWERGYQGETVIKWI